MFDDLSHADRLALLERLATLDPESIEGRFLNPVLSYVLLSEPDIERLIGMAEVTSWWDRVDAVDMLNRLMASG